MIVRRISIAMVLTLMCFAIGDGSRPALATEIPPLESTPWFDADESRVVPVQLAPEFEDSENRSSRWLPKAERVAKPLASSSSGSGGTGWTWGNIFATGLLAIIFVAIVVGLLYAFANAEVNLGPRYGQANGRIATDQQTIERIQELPAELGLVEGDLREQAVYWMQMGRFDRAIVALFGHQLLLLDRATLLRLARGKTNGRYVRETHAADARSGEILSDTVTAFERSYFGRHAISHDQFSRLWAANEQLEQYVQTHFEVAA